MLLVVVLGLAGSLWATDPHLGTWKFNAAQSKYPPGQPVPKEATFVIRAAGDQIEVTATWTEANGTTGSLKSTYPQEGGLHKWVGPVPAAVAGEILVTTVVTPYELYETVLKDGKQQQVNHVVISKDGKTTHETVKGKNAQGKPFEELRVFEKQ
jgi:hypothetical protein